MNYNLPFCKYDDCGKFVSEDKEMTRIVAERLNRYKMLSMMSNTKPNNIQIDELLK